MKKELDLSGLKQVFSGLVLQMVAAFFIGSMAGGLTTGKTFSGFVACAIGAAALLMILSGLSKLGDASVFFLSARKSFLIQLVLHGILFVILLVLKKIGWNVDHISGMSRSNIIEVLFLLVILLAVWILSILFSVRTVLRGCGHVAEQTNDPLFSMKCIKTWRLWYMAFLLTILMMMSGMAVIVTVLRKTMENGTAGEELSQMIFTNVASSVLLVSIVSMAVLIFLIVAHIMYLGKVRGAYREYHLEEVVIPEPGEQKPVFADYVQRELADGRNTAENTDEETEFPEDAASEEDADELYFIEETYGAEETEFPEDGSEPVRKLYSGRKYRKVVQAVEEEQEPDPEQILEITKLFRKKGRKD